MQARILTADDYFKYFNFNEPNTACGIEQEAESGENYFSAQIYLPKIFFDLDNLAITFNPLFRMQMGSLPDKILLKIELFAIGSIGEKEAFVFKPWIIGIDNPILYNALENFHLFVPSTIFYNLLERLIFLEQLNQQQFEFIRILQDIPSVTFQRFGLDRLEVNRAIASKNLQISRIDEPNTNEITKFYDDNWQGLTSALQSKYFRPLLNTWFKVKLNTGGHTIGYIRLYNNNNSFTGGTSIEYIIEKSYRKNGYATESASALINFLRHNSYIMHLGGEVNDNNEYSIKVLRKLGFENINNNGQFSNDNFHLSLLGGLRQMEGQYKQNNLEFRVQKQYVDKYRRYFEA